MNQKHLLDKQSTVHYCAGKIKKQTKQTKNSQVNLLCVDLVWVVGAENKIVQLSYLIIFCLKCYVPLYHRLSVLYKI